MPAPGRQQRPEPRSVPHAGPQSSPTQRSPFAPRGDGEKQPSPRTLSAGPRAPATATWGPRGEGSRGCRGQSPGTTQGPDQWGWSENRPILGDLGTPGSEGVTAVSSTAGGVTLRGGVRTHALGSRPGDGRCQVPGCGRQGLRAHPAPGGGWVPPGPQGSLEGSLQKSDVPAVPGSLPVPADGHHTAAWRPPGPPEQPHRQGGCPALGRAGPGNISANGSRSGAKAPSGRAAHPPHMGTCGAPACMNTHPPARTHVCSHSRD